MKWLLANKYFFASLFFAFPAVFSLFSPGLPPTHDGEYHVIRFYEFFQVLKDGVLYPRWAPDLNNGFGVPLFNYVYPLPNFFAAFFHLFGASFIAAFKINLIAASFVGAGGMFLWIRGFFGERAGFVSSVLYTYAPYHFVDIYVRGSVGEVWALGLFPLFLWSITKVLKEKHVLHCVLSGILLALVIFSHNILAVMFMTFAITYVGLLFILEKEKREVKMILLSFILGLGLSTIFWLPALLEKSHVVGLQIYSVHENFPELYQLLIPSWGTGFSSGSLENQMSFQIGIAQLFAVFLASIAFWLAQKTQKILIAFFLLWFFLVLLLMLQVSGPLWKAIPLMQFFQFPWRFLSLIILVSAFLSGAVVAIFSLRFAAFAFVIVSVGVTLPYTKPAYYHMRDDAYYITRENFIHSTNSPGNTFNTKWFKRGLLFRKNRIESSGNISIQAQTIKPTRFEFSAESSNVQDVTVNVAYFPGWVGTVNGKDVSTFPDADGLVSFPIDHGKSNVVVQLKDTPIRLASVYVSIFFFILATGILLVRLKR